MMPLCREKMLLRTVFVLGVFACLSSFMHPSRAEPIVSTELPRPQPAIHVARVAEGRGRITATFKRTDARQPSAAFVFLPCCRRSVDQGFSSIRGRLVTNVPISLLTAAPLKDSFPGQCVWHRASGRRQSWATDKWIGNLFRVGDLREMFLHATAETERPDDGVEADAGVSQEEGKNLTFQCDETHCMKEGKPSTEAGLLEIVSEPLSRKESGDLPFSKLEVPLDGRTDRHETSEGGFRASASDSFLHQDQMANMTIASHKETQLSLGRLSPEWVAEEALIQKSLSPSASDEEDQGIYFPSRRELLPVSRWITLFRSKFQKRNLPSPRAFAAQLLRCLPTTLTCMRIGGSALLWMRQFHPLFFSKLAFWLGGSAGLTVASASVMSPILFSLSAATDALDGALARKLGAETSGGALLDAVSDKLLIATALAGVVQGAGEAASAASPISVSVASNASVRSSGESFVADSPIEVFRLLGPAAALLTLREVGIQALRQQLERQGRGHLTQVSKTGKMKMVAQSLALPLLLLLFPRSSPPLDNALKRRALKERAPLIRQLSRHWKWPARAAASLWESLRNSAVGILLLGIPETPSPSLVSRLFKPFGCLVQKSWTRILSCMDTAFWGLERGARVARTLRLSPAGFKGLLLRGNSAKQVSVARRLAPETLTCFLGALVKVGRFAGRVLGGGCLWVCRRKPLCLFADAVLRSRVLTSTASALRTVLAAARSCEQTLRCTYIQGAPSLMTVGVILLWSANVLALASAAEYAYRAAFMV